MWFWWTRMEDALEFPMQTGTKWWSTRRILGLPRSFSLFYEAPGGLRSASDRYGSHRFGNHSEIEIINLLGMFTYPILQVWDYPVEFAGWSYPNLGILKKHRWKRLSSCSIWWENRISRDNIHIFCYWSFRLFDSIMFGSIFITIRTQSSTNGGWQTCGPTDSSCWIASHFIVG